MKGLSMPEDIGMTLILLVVVMMMVVMVFFIYIEIFLKIGNDQSAYSIDFVSIANKPYLVADVLAYTKLGDRQVLEQAIEIAATGSAENAGAAGLPENLTNFMKVYGTREYYISIKSNGREFMNADSNEYKCGADDEGWCVFGDCDVGRVEISNDKCVSAWQKCCKEDKAAYAATVNKHPVVTCGGGRGVCSEGVKPLFQRWTCTQNRIDIGTQECTGTTPICCAPKTEDNQIAVGNAAKASVPLLYKLNYGILEVSIK